jgi:hypothetical protein
MSLHETLEVSPPKAKNLDNLIGPMEKVDPIENVLR